MPDFTHLSLFSGIGGLDLAAEWAGFRTVGQCEWADYPQAILQKHWPDVPKWRDIRTLTRESFYERTGMGTVDVVSGGFPCQPFSVAGKQKGKEDDRYLWPEMLRVIRELTPRWVVGENVPGILRIAAADVVADLEREGYHVVVFDFEAAAVGALHRRERVAFVGYTDGEREQQPCRKQFEGGKRIGNGSEAVAYPESARMEGFCGEYPAVKSGRPGKRQSDAEGESPILYTEREGLQKRDGERMGQSKGHEESKSSDCKNVRRGNRDGRAQWSVEPDVGRVAHGVSNRVDRLKCLGNAVVPQQFYPIFRAIMEVMIDAEL